MKYLLILSTLLFIGCGDAQEGDKSPANTSSTINMVLNKSYNVHTGDHVQKKSSDTQVEIIKNVEDKETTVTLLQGSAQLIRAN